MILDGMTGIFYLPKCNLDRDSKNRNLRCNPCNMFSHHNLQDVRENNIKRKESQEKECA